jgi:ubiquitin
MKPNKPVNKHGKPAKQVGPGEQQLEHSHMDVQQGQSDQSGQKGDKEIDKNDAKLVRLRAIVPRVDQGSGQQIAPRKLGDVIRELREWMAFVASSPSSSADFKSDDNNEVLVLVRQYLKEVLAQHRAAIAPSSSSSRGDVADSAAVALQPHTACLIFCLLAEVLKTARSSLIKKTGGDWASLVADLLGIVATGVIGTTIKEKDLSTAKKVSLKAPCY